MAVFLLFVFDQPVDGALVARVDDGGSAHSNGAIHIRDGKTNITLRADGTASASCNDSGGESKLVRASFGLVDAKTRESSLGVILPGDETDEHGRVKVRFLWDREGQPAQEFEAWLKINIPGQRR